MRVLSLPFSPTIIISKMKSLNNTVRNHSRWALIKNMWHCYWSIPHSHQPVTYYYHNYYHTKYDNVHQVHIYTKASLLSFRQKEEKGQNSVDNLSRFPNSFMVSFRRFHGKQTGRKLIPEPTCYSFKSQFCWIDCVLWHACKVNVSSCPPCQSVNWEGLVM